MNWPLFFILFSLLLLAIGASVYYRQYKRSSDYMYAGWASTSLIFGWLFFCLGWALI